MFTRVFRIITIVSMLVLILVTFAVPFTTANAASTLTMLGADVGSLQRAEDLGQKFFNASGAQQDPLDILKGIGVNYIRLRIWNNPASGYNNQTKVLAFAKIVKAKGLKLMIDFHYRSEERRVGKECRSRWSP